jgi:hypothetical protein
LLRSEKTLVLLGEKMMEIVCFCWEDGDKQGLWESKKTKNLIKKKKRLLNEWH